jgi:hypothetical protein
MGYYGPFPTSFIAYHKDGSGNEYLGEAAKGTSSSSPKWKILQLNYTGDNWIMYFPVDNDTGKASDEPKFVWDDVESYIYRELGT